MSAASVFGGLGLLIAAYSFHVRARLLGRHGQGWPAAPVLVRLAIDVALLPMFVAGAWWIIQGVVPQWLQAAVSLGLAIYGATMALNLARQRVRR